MGQTAPPLSPAQLWMKRTLSWSTHSPSVYISTCLNRFNSTPNRFNSSQYRKLQIIEIKTGKLNLWGALALRVHQYLQSQPNSIQFTAAVNSINCNSSHSKPQLSMKRTLSWSTHSPSVYIRTCSNRFNSTPTRFNSSQCRKVEFIKLGSQICRTHSTSVYISTCNLKQIHILSGVASPVTTYHAAKESMSVNLKKNGNFKIDPLVVEHALARSVHQYLQSQTGLIRDTAASRLNSKHSRKMQVFG